MTSASIARKKDPARRGWPGFVGAQWAFKGQGEKIVTRRRRRAAQAADKEEERDPRVALFDGAETADPQLSASCAPFP